MDSKILEVQYDPQQHTELYSQADLDCPFPGQVTPEDTDLAARFAANLVPHKLGSTKACPTCKGTGNVGRVPGPCIECAGDGEIPTRDLFHDYGNPNDKGASEEMKRLATRLGAGKGTWLDFMRSMKNAPEHPTSLVLKYMIHRFNHLADYEAGDSHDEEFWARHEQTRTHRYSRHLTLDDVKGMAAANAHIMGPLLAYRRGLHDLLKRGSGPKVRDIDGKTYIALTRSLESPYMGPEEALRSFAHGPDPAFGSFRYHTWVPLDDVWYSFDLAPRFPNGNMGPEAELLVSNMGTRYEASKDDTLPMRYRSWGRETPPLHFLPPEFYVDGVKDAQVAQYAAQEMPGLIDEIVKHEGLAKDISEAMEAKQNELDKLWHDAEEQRKQGKEVSWEDQQRQKLAIQAKWDPIITKLCGNDHGSIPPPKGTYKALAIIHHPAAGPLTGNVLRSLRATVDGLEPVKGYFGARGHLKVALQDNPNVYSDEEVYHKLYNDNVGYHSQWLSQVPPDMIIQLSRDGHRFGVMAIQAALDNKQLTSDQADELLDSTIGSAKGGALVRVPNFAHFINSPVVSDNAKLRLATWIDEIPDSEFEQMTGSSKPSFIHDLVSELAVVNLPSQVADKLAAAPVSAFHIPPYAITKNMSRQQILASTLPAMAKITNRNTTDQDVLELVQDLDTYTARRALIERHHAQNTLSDTLMTKLFRLSVKDKALHSAMDLTYKNKDLNPAIYKAAMDEILADPGMNRQMANYIVNGLESDRSRPVAALEAMWPEGVPFPPESPHNKGMALRQGTAIDVDAAKKEFPPDQVGKEVARRLLLQMLADAILRRRSLEDLRKKHIILPFPKHLAKSADWDAVLRQWLSQQQRRRGYWFGTDMDTAAQIMEEQRIVASPTPKFLEGKVVWAVKAGSTEYEDTLAEWARKQGTIPVIVYFETDQEPHQDSSHPSQFYWPHDIDIVNAHVEHVKLLKAEEELIEAEFLLKTHTTFSLPKLGIEDRRETKLVTTPAEHATALAAGTNMVGMDIAKIPKYRHIPKADIFRDVRSELKQDHERTRGIAYGGKPSQGEAAISFAFGTDPKTLQPRNVEGTQQHEDLHRIFGRVRDKYGDKAVENLIHNMWEALPEISRKVVASWVSTVSPHKDETKTLFREEAMAYLLNYLNSPTTRGKIVGWQPLTQRRMFDTHMKRAHRHLLAIAETADNRWLAPQRPWLQFRPTTAYQQSLTKSTLDDKLAWLNASTHQPETWEHDVAGMMLGQDEDVEAHLAAAKFLSGKEPDQAKYNMALRLYGDHVKAALYAVGLPDNARNAKAMAGLLGIPMQKAEPVSVMSIQPAHETGKAMAEAITRALEANTIAPVKMKGKHIKGAQIAKDPQTDIAYLLKPGSGKLSPGAGISEERASQSVREAAFYQAGKLMGLEDWLSATELMLVNAQEWAAMLLVPYNYQTMDKLNREDPTKAATILAPYLKDGIVHRWAVADWVLGNVDSHGQNILSDGESVKLIDHGSCFAGESFDPAHDTKSFIPFYLRAWAGKDFAQMEPKDRLDKMPVLDHGADLVFRTWVASIDHNKLGHLLTQYGINPKPTLDRLAQLQAYTGDNLSHYVCGLWAGVSGRVEELSKAEPKAPKPAIVKPMDAKPLAKVKGSGPQGKLHVVSLFDGLGGARLALKNLGANVLYTRSEIDKHTNKIHQKHFPDSNNLGDVTKIDYNHLAHPVDILIGGSPCQDLSIGRTLDVKGRKGLKGDKSHLFFEYVRALHQAKPKHFIFENVGSMSPADRDLITKHLGVEPILLDAGKITGARRPRYFWTNIPVDQLQDNGSKFVDSLDQMPDKSLYLSPAENAYMDRKSGKKMVSTPWRRHGMRSADPKAGVLVANLSRGVPYNAVEDHTGKRRKLAPHEVERLLLGPGHEGYTEGVSTTQRLRMLGNGFSVPVIEHILKGLTKPK